MPGLKNSWEYFPSKKGLVSGLILSFYSVGSIFALIITQHVVNPNNIEPVFYKAEHGYYYTPESEVV